MASNRPRTMQVFVREHCTMIAAPVQCDVDGIPKGSHSPINPNTTAFQSNKQLAAAQGSSLSPLTKKGSISLYSRIFTVASLGALPCAIARNACSDCATIARARSFL